MGVVIDIVAPTDWLAGDFRISFIGHFKNKEQEFLREINCLDSRSAKIGVFAIL